MPDQGGSGKSREWGPQSPPGPPCQGYCSVSQQCSGQQNPQRWGPLNTSQDRALSSWTGKEVASFISAGVGGEGFTPQLSTGAEAGWHAFPGRVSAAPSSPPSLLPVSPSPYYHLAQDRMTMDTGSDAAATFQGLLGPVCCTLPSPGEKQRAGAASLLSPSCTEVSCPAYSSLEATSQVCHCCVRLLSHGWHQDRLCGCEMRTGWADV